MDTKIKKILIISYNTLNILGGIEKYNNKLVDILVKSYPNVSIHMAVMLKKNDDYFNQNVTYHFVDLPEKKNIKIFDLFNEKMQINKYMNKLQDEYGFDMIINSTYIDFNKLSKMNNYFLIQHGDLSTYVGTLISNEHRVKHFLACLYSRMFLSLKKILKHAKNIVVFDDVNYNNIKKYTNANLYIISLFNSNSNITTENNFNSRNKILFLGRIDERQKNIAKLIEINDQINLIEFMGPPSFEDGEYYKDILEKKNLYLGNSSNEELIKNIIDSHKFMILYSKYEGFPFSLVESLSYGVPIIVKNTFASASFLCNKKTGLLLERNSTIQDDIKKIKEFYSMDEKTYEQYCLNCLEFYKNNLDLDIFVKKWEKIFNIFLRNN